ncbi:hypothetical protein EYF80_036279 [Liparis tanakae]|uniref:Uncharacterized protein n=1 Tax=Liparis tanakae TaxID=230148 RepID=A0A4Z2GJ77_9TELE|nr:hypothetical protein EYF80_036279 [Liparis tanakae]
MASREGDMASHEGDMASRVGDMASRAGDMASCEGDMASREGDMASREGDMASCEGAPAAGRVESKRRAQSRDVQVLDQMTDPVHYPARRLTTLPQKLMQRHESSPLASHTHTLSSGGTPLAAPAKLRCTL